MEPSVFVERQRDVGMVLLVVQGGEYEAAGPIHGPRRSESGVNSLVLPTPSVLH